MNTTPPAPDAAALARLLDPVCAIARDAAAVVMAVYASPFEARSKQDASPVTEADERAEALITPRLAALLPGVPVVAEEAVSAGQVPTVDRSFWLVDPLDGTKEFLARNGEFTVNIALIQDGRPVLGVVVAPAVGRLYAGAAGTGAWREAYGAGSAGGRTPLAVRQPPAEGLTVVSSRSHGDESALEAFLAGRKVAGRREAGSSLKLCLVAEAEADVYPRLGRTMEWDIAAGHAVLAAAGGSVLTVQGTPLLYGKPGFENPHFAAWGAAAA